MAMRKPEADDTLSRMHRQHAKDKENDRVETGSFPVVVRKPKRTSSLDANRSKARLITNVFVVLLCALLGYGYVMRPRTSSRRPNASPSRTNRPAASSPAVCRPRGRG